MFKLNNFEQKSFSIHKRIYRSMNVHFISFQQTDQLSITISLTMFLYRIASYIRFNHLIHWIWLNYTKFWNFFIFHIGIINFHLPFHIRFSVWLLPFHVKYFFISIDVPRWIFCFYLLVHGKSPTFIFLAESFIPEKIEKFNVTSQRKRRIFPIFSFFPKFQFLTFFTFPPKSGS